MWKSLFGSYARTLLAIGLIALLVQGASAHTYLSSVVLGGSALAEGDCVRPHPGTAFDSPIPLVTDPEMTCGWLPYAAQPANRACPIQAGDTIGVQWHHNNDGATDDIMDPTHKGPILYYLAKSDDGAGDVWFKIYEDGYDASTSQWATDKMIANRGLMTITIPSDIAPGSYLLRGEVFALHNAYVIDGVQPYVGCVELTISGSGSATPAGVAIPGTYQDTDPGLNVNVYQPIQLPYIIPGPALYVSGSAPSSSGASDPSSSGASDPSSSGASDPSSGSASSGDSSQPTDAPVEPTSAPTDAPSSGSASGSSNPPPTGGSLQVAMNQGSNEWWLGVIVSGGSETTTAVDIMDSGVVSTWAPLQQMPYAWVYSHSVQLTLPISVRLTGASPDHQVVYNDIFTEWAQTGAAGSSDYSSSSNIVTPPYNPTWTPTHPTNPPSNPNPPSSGDSRMGVTLYHSVNEWWFALTVNNPASTVASVEVKDSDSISTYALMTYASWGYSLPANGKPFVAPLTVRITDVDGKSVTATIPSLTPGATAATQ